jgi:phosphoribosylanthranilate isomerase
MIQIKICGLTTPEMALHCAEQGADAIGLVFFPKSPRHVTDDTARAICEALPERVQKIGVFVDETAEFILKKAHYCGLTGVQLHGREAPESVRRLRGEGLLVLKGLFASRKPAMDAASDYDPTAFLVECGKGVLPGGNAAEWNWSGARAFGRRHPLVLAGGLAPENVVEAIAAAQPDAVDVSSGVEAGPGVKDPARIDQFIGAVRGAGEKRIARRIFGSGEAVLHPTEAIRT